MADVNILGKSQPYCGLRNLVIQLRKRATGYTNDKYKCHPMQQSISNEGRV